MILTEAMIHLVSGVKETPWDITLLAQVGYDPDEEVLPENFEVNAIYRGVIQTVKENMRFCFLHSWHFSIRGVEFAIYRRQYDSGAWGDFSCLITPVKNKDSNLLIA